MKLTAVGFLTLFLELALIRFLPAQIWNLGYFPNFVLLAAFAGIGLGFLLHPYFSEARSRIGFALSFFALGLLLMFVFVFSPSIPNFGNWGGELGGELFFTSISEQQATDNVFPLIVCFALIVGIFALLSQQSAKLFLKYRPLKAYSLDILGSCLGIVTFMLFSYLELAPTYWFLVIAALSIPIVLESIWVTIFLSAVVLVNVFIVSYIEDENPRAKSEKREFYVNHWSPYQRLEYLRTKSGKHLIFANGIIHQTMMDQTAIENAHYSAPYRNQFGKPENVLIIGAGSGNDVLAALRGGQKALTL